MSTSRILIATTVLAVIFGATLAEANHTASSEVRAPAIGQPASSPQDGDTSVPSASAALTNRTDVAGEQSPTF
jgi:hypothetical protein